MYRNTIIPQTAPGTPPRVPAPSHRHGAPSGPWPFLDLEDEVDPTRMEDPDSHLPMSASPCEHARTRDQEVCWCKYPQALYPNWTSRQQKKSQISSVIELKKADICTLHYLDVMEDGKFVNPGAREVNEKSQDMQWLAIQQGRPQGVNVRALFAGGLSGPVLQILGTRYNIEPFFFSSTIGWIPSRFQSHVVPNESDHITITLSFIKSIPNPTTVPSSPNPSVVSTVSAEKAGDEKLPDLVIDTQGPLPLRSSNHLLIHDLLAVHMVRSPAGNTIISLHPNSDPRVTTAESLHNRIQLTGRSVYWSNIFKDTTDPTFVLLSFLWYGLYAWDETLENLYNHVSFLESQVIVTNDFGMTRELHVISAHLLHYQSLLQDFRKSIHFVLETTNPSMQARKSSASEADHEFEHLRKRSELLMKRECDNLLLEVDRLERSRKMMQSRLKNVMDLEFSIINIEDSRGMQTLTEATVKDSAAMKQIAYLTMFFMPASFVANIFGMNVEEINPGTIGTLPHFFFAALPLTALTIWIIVAYQIQITEPRIQDEQGGGVELEDLSTAYGFGMGINASENVRLRKLNIWARLWWPVLLASTVMERRRVMRERRMQRRIDPK